MELQEWAIYCSLARHGMVRAQSGLRKHSIQIITIGLIEVDQSGSNGILYEIDVERVKADSDLAD